MGKSHFIYVTFFQRNYYLPVISVVPYCHFPIYSSISPSPLVVPCTTVSCFLKYYLFTQGEEKFTFIEKM